MSQRQQMAADDHPPMPERFDVVTRGTEQVPVWTAEDMRAYAAACVAAERERCARIVEAHRVPVGNSAAGELAAQWTMDALREIGDAIRGA
jgi:hypothetical protein